MNQATAIRMGLVIAVLGVYGQVLGFEFIEYDDTGYVTRNIEVQRGLSWEGLRWAFTTDSLSNWHPITWLSHQLDVTLFGLNPSGHHAMSLLLHLVNVLLLFGLLRGLTGAVWRSAAAAAIFALHPLQVESAAWIAERKNLLSTLFWLLACSSYGRYALSGRRTPYALAIVWMGVGLMCKPTLVTLPFVLLLLDYWPLSRTSRGTTLYAKASLIAEKVPMFALAAASCVVTLMVQKHGGAMSAGDAIPLVDRLANALVAYGLYLWRLVWPFSLGVYYPHPNFPESGGVPLSAVQIATAALALIVCTVAIALSRRRYAAVGWLWFLGTLVPTIGLVQVGTQAMADRYVYVPMIGLSILLSWGGRDLWAALRARTHWLGTAAAGSALMLSLVWGVAAWGQVGYWRNSLTLFNHTLEFAPRNSGILLNVGVALQTEGQIDAAIQKYRAALEVRPVYPLALVNLGTALRERGDLAGATRALQRAIEMDPALALAHYNLANALAASGNLDDAVAHYARTLELEPQNVPARVNLGSALATRGELMPAIIQFRRVLELDPENDRARKNLDLALQQLRQR